MLSIMKRLLVLLIGRIETQVTINQTESLVILSKYKSLSSNRRRTFTPSAAACVCRAGPRAARRRSLACAAVVCRPVLTHGCALLVSPL